MDSKTLIVEIQNNVLCVVLNRPEKRNALNERMIKELCQTFNQYAESDDILAATITGKGEAFCAGADLAYLHSLVDKSYKENLDDSKAIRDMYWSIYTFPKPTIAIVNGPAVAGGCGLVNVCDMAIASDAASFGYPEVKIGFVASLVSVFLIYTIGFRNTLYLLLTGKIIDAGAALNLGLIHRVVHKNDLLSAAEALINEIIQNSPRSLKLSKEIVHNYIDDDMRSMLERACEFNARSRQNPDFKEGLLSFLEKRKPVWQKNTMQIGG